MIPLCHFMQGMMWLHARNVIFLKKSCCTRHVLEDFDSKTNFKGHAETCLLILFSSLGCAVFPPMVSSNFLGWCPKTMRKETQAMRKSAKNEHHKMWLSRHEPTTHGPPLVCFFPLIFRNFGQKLQKHREHQKKQTTLKNTSQWTSKSGWDRDFFKTNVVLFLCFFFWFLFGQGCTN